MNRPGDRIELRGITATGFHGVFEHEKRDGQPFVVDVVLGLDLHAAGATDRLADTVDYGAVAGRVVARITGEPLDLIERLAELVAADLLEDTRVRWCEVTVHKPSAPIPHPFGDVAVVVHRRRGERGTPVVIAIGGNLGDRVATFTEAIDAIDRLPVTQVVGVSDLIETEAVGGPAQPDYLNAVVLARSHLDAPALLSALHRIEADLGRVRDVRWGPRTIDLDLIQVGRPGRRNELRSDRAELTLPHPRAHDRAFVLWPWAQVDPGAQLRLPGQPAGADPPIVAVRDLLERADISGVRPGPTWPRSSERADRRDEDR